MTTSSNIIFDIETQGDRAKALSYAEPFKAFEPLPPFDVDAVPLGNAKNPDLIKEKQEKAALAYPKKVEEHLKNYEQAKLAYEAKIVDKAALSAYTARVLAIGLEIDGEFRMLAGDEADMLSTFWDIFEESTSKFVGFNINKFDVPFLVRRSWKLGVIPPNIYNGRYLTNKFIDLMEVASCGEFGTFLSLGKLCDFLGVEGKFQGDCTGASFADKFTSDIKGDYELAVEYLKCDIKATKKVAEILLRERNTEENFDLA